jgi:hypothetical protein
VYPEFFSLVNSDLQSKMLEISDSEKLVSKEYIK